MASENISEKTHLLKQQNQRNDGERTENNITEAWKSIISTFSSGPSQRVRFDSIESVDSQGSDFSSLQSFSSFEERKEWLLSFEAYLRNMDYYCDNQSSKYYEYPIHLLLSSFVVCFIGILWSTYGSISNVWLTGFLYTSSALLGMSSIYYFVKGHYLNNKIPILTKIFDKSRNNNRKN